jgi:multicomponent Na+:H+ antiporter subunit D
MLVLAPLLVSLATALACVLVAARPRLQSALSLAGALALLACAFALLVQVMEDGTIRLALGNWPPPFGIEFAADRLGTAMVVVAALMGGAALGFQTADADAASGDGALHPLVHGLLAGACGAFLTADLFNLYVWFELMLICALGLLLLRGGTPRSLEAAFKYFALNVFGTLLLLAAVALLYGATGHLNFGALGAAARHMDGGVLLPFVTLLLLALLMKAGAFPLFAWLPAAYHSLPAPLLALFAALLTKVGVYAVLRLLADVFAASPSLLYQALGWIAVLTMVSGVLGAAYHWDMRRILAFHIVSQIGYMLLGIALASTAGSAGAMFYMWHNMVVKGALILIAAMVFRLSGHYDLRRIGGLYAARPWLATLFLLTAFAQVGIPPLSGFWGKLILVRESFIQGEPLWGAAALGVGVLTLYSMAKIWMEAFWKPHPDRGWQAPRVRLAPAYAVTTALAALALGVGLYPEPFIAFAGDAVQALGGGR